MTADDKKRVRQRVIHDILIRYGAGAEYIQKFASTQHWNSIAWALIALGTLGWIVFLTWQP